MTVRVVANDTEIVLLVHHLDAAMADVYLRRPSPKASANEYSVRDIVISVGPVVKSYLLFAHAWSGCDTTSDTFGHGKNTIMKRLINDTNARNLIDMNSKPNKTALEVGEAGAKSFSVLFGCDKGENPDHAVKVARLPPNGRFARFHAIRVHLQIAEWHYLTLNPVERSWSRASREQYEPVPTDSPPTPDSVLNFLRCECKSTKNQCASKPVFV